MKPPPRRQLQRGHRIRVGRDAPQGAGQCRLTAAGTSRPQFVGLRLEALIEVTVPGPHHQSPLYKRTIPASAYCKYAGPGQSTHRAHPASTCTELEITIRKPTKLNPGEPRENTGDPYPTRTQKARAFKFYIELEIRLRKDGGSTPTFHVNRASHWHVT